jgi:hypothetical protein
MCLRSREEVPFYYCHLTGFSDDVHYTPCQLGPSAFMYMATENTTWFIQLFQQ